MLLHTQSAGERTVGAQWGLAYPLCSRFEDVDHRESTVLLALGVSFLHRKNEKGVSFRS